MAIAVTHANHQSSPPRGFAATLLGVWLLIALVPSTALGGPPASTPDVAEQSAGPTDLPTESTAEGEKPKEKARRSYLGRVLAPPMTHEGAWWLTRTNRDEEERTSESFQQMKLTEGMTVCDMGCGNGYWTLPMARDVGETGRVLAVDIQPQMLRLLRIRAAKVKLPNIEPILGKIDDPNLPVGELDLVLMVDVYHEFSHPQSMLWEIRRALKPKGLIALLEFRSEDPDVPIKVLHKMSKHQIMKEYQANGFKLVREYNELPRQHLMFFARDDSPLEEIQPVSAADVLRKLHAPE